MKTVGRIVAALCFVPAIGIPAHFLWRFAEEPWKDAPIPWLPPGLLPVYGVLIFTVVPYGLYLGTTELSRKIASPAARGCFGGMVAMLWCDTVLITLPSLGVYVNFAPVIAANRITHDDTWGRSAWIWVLVLNLTIWAAAGIAAGLVRGRRPSHGP